MTQRFSLDRRSFEQFLAAASLVQQFQKQAAGNPTQENLAQPLLELLETQKAIDSGDLDQNSALERIVRLTLRAVGGQGTAVWLFSNDEFVYRTGCGKAASRDERLRMMVLARVAAICDPSRESFPGQREWAKGAGDSGYYPGCVRSLIVGPIYRNQAVAGALAAFSTDFDAFDHRDASNIRLLSGLIGNAMERAAQQEARSVAQPRQQVLQLIEQIVPTLERLVKQEDFTRSVQVPPVNVTVEKAFPVDALPPAVVLSEEVQLLPALTPEPPLEAAVPIARESTAEGVVPEPQLIEDLSEAAALQPELTTLRQNIAELESVKQSALEAQREKPETAIEPLVAAPAEDFAKLPVEASVANQEIAPVSSESPELEAVRMEDTAVPGIGVRAALYDDEEEPFRLAARTREWTAESIRSIAAATANMFHASERLASWISNNLRTLGQQSRRLTSYRAQLPTFPTARVSKALHQTQSSIAERTNRVRVQLRDKRLRLPRIPTSGAGDRIKQTAIFFEQVARGAAAALNSVVSSLPDLPGFSADSAKRQFREAQASAVEAVRKISRNSGMVQQYRLRIRLNGQVLRRSASAFAVLFVMTAFLAMESGLFKPENTAAAGARQVQTQQGSSAALVHNSVREAASGHSETSASPRQNTTAAAAPTVSGPASHRTITDPATEEIVLNLTRYEVTTLRRQAAGGDEEAAFQLAMAYETGYETPQNCSKAAEWVTKAAEAGYPAAQYNLGLRYRNGDGVPIDAVQAEKWLSKAASLKYRPARVALAVISQQKSHE